MVRRPDQPPSERADPEVVLDNVPEWAWEQKRAAASGPSAVEIVERVVTVPIQQPPSLPRQHTWVDLLRVLSQQLDGGAVYDRHLLAIAAAQDVVRAAQRRSLGVRADPHVGRWECSTARG
jgi:hypothetical protein